MGIQRISNETLNTYEDVIALLNRIQREMDAIERSMDIDTRTFNYDRSGVIHKAAKAAKQLVIDKMHQEKQAAANGRG